MYRKVIFVSDSLLAIIGKQVNMNFQRAIVNELQLVHNLTDPSPALVKIEQSNILHQNLFTKPTIFTLFFRLLPLGSVHTERYR